MAKYILTSDGHLYHCDIDKSELYHYGVKGMKWGVKNKRELKVAKRFARAGKKQGVADYYRDQGKNAYKKHDENARVLDKTAKKYESQGAFIKAQVARKSAAALRARGENIKARNDAIADKYNKKVEKLTEKAKTYATKKRVDLGTKKVNSILGETKKKAYEREKAANDRAREYEIQDKLGDRGYGVYNKVRGKS